MALTPRKQDKFYDEGGSGQDAPSAPILAQAKEMKNADKGEGHKQLLADRVMGPFMVNLQHGHEDIDNVRTFITDEDEILNVVKGTFPLGCYYDGTTSKWTTPFTATEIMGLHQPSKKGALDGLWGYSQVRKGFPWPWYDSLSGGNAFVEKFIPIGFKPNRVIVYGSNSGSSPSTFKIYQSEIDGNDLVGVGDSSNSSANFGAWKTVDSSASVNGDGNKCITICIDIDKNDTVYGGKIELTQI